MLNFCKIAENSIKVEDAIKADDKIMNGSKSELKKPVIHVNVILLSNPCDLSLSQLVNDVLSKKKKPLPLRRSGLMSTQYRPSATKGDYFTCLQFNFS